MVKRTLFIVVAAFNAAICVATATAAQPLLRPAGEAKAPAAFHQFCQQRPSECAVRNVSAGPVRLSPAKRAQLRGINLHVNRTIRQVTDMQQHGRSDRWNIPTSGMGDCEDIALMKRKLLIEAGWPSSALLMTTARDRRGAGHAVLTVITDQGDYVLDNRTNAIRPWHSTPYRYFTRQSTRSPRSWVRLSAAPATGSEISRLPERNAQWVALSR